LLSTVYTTIDSRVDLWKGAWVLHWSFIYDPSVVPIFFGIVAVLALVGVMIATL